MHKEVCWHFCRRHGEWSHEVPYKATLDDYFGCCPQCGEQPKPPRRVPRPVDAAPHVIEAALPSELINDLASLDRFLAVRRDQ